MSSCEEPAGAAAGEGRGGAAAGDERANAPAADGRGGAATADDRGGAAAINTPTGKRLLALVRGADYAHPGEEEAIRLLLAGLAPDPERRLLDAGCGSGGTAAWVQAAGYGRVTGIEIDAATARLARERHPEVAVVTGDVQRAGDAVAGPFDLIYSMTALYAVPDQRAALAQLGALAAPGAYLRLFEYSDPRGGFAAAAEGRSSYAWWRPLDPRTLPDLLAGTGWIDVRLRDLRPEFIVWYRRLLDRIAARRDVIEREFGREWYDLAVSDYQGILRMVHDGDLGGLLAQAVRAPV